MGSPSINAFSVFCHNEYHKFRNPHCGCSDVKSRPTVVKSRPTAVAVTSKSFSPQSKLQFKLQFLNKSNILITRSHSKILPIHISSISLNPALRRRKKIPYLLSEKLVYVLLGSLIFMGSFNTRSVVAVPTQESSDQEHREQNSGNTQNGEFQDEELYLKMLEEDPTNVEALKVVLFGKMRQGETKKAVDYVERLIALEPNEVEWRLLQALCYEMIGDLGMAKKLFKDILQQRPLLLRALHGLAMVMHKNHEGPAVYEMLIKALDVAQEEKKVPEARNIRILIAQMHVVQGDLEEGLNNFQVLIAENPRDFRPYLCQGIIYSLLGRRKEAEEQFEAYHDLVPQEFAQRGFLDDVVLAAKTKPEGQFDKEFQPEFPHTYRK